MPNRNESLNSIAKHVSTLNEELGIVKNDITEVKVNIGKLETNVKWIKKVMGYMAPLLTAIFITILGATIKYLFLS